MGKTFLKLLMGFFVGVALLALPAKASDFQQETITLTKKNVVRVLYGVVLDPSGAPMEGVQVDILDHPELMVKAKSEADVEQRIMASARTNADGKFRLKNLPDGKYDVRFTATGFNELHMYVKVKSRSGKVKGIEVELPIAH
ncbi:MAG: carboxypeptidase-like regulatory domain-containing protein [Acidobacteria bacterium]|nr:carboxypeptidase-like regulatory domain-containing protein [Acidobacteriota bacterium]